NALKGGNSGAVIKPGVGKNSRLIHLVSGQDPDLKMPPTGKGLSADEVGRLRAWIDQGAHWPKDVVLTAPSSSQSHTHWSYLPIQRPTIPKVSQPHWIRNPIDSFILAGLDAGNIAPAPEADRVTLIRRLCLDLLGLPPSLEEVDAFLNDTQPQAYERLVDRLLDSPHYGERWGRHWLDLARYADSDGYEKDTGRPHAWRFREWVIEALNRDLPFDQFAIEQLAGDLLANPTLDQKIATGFHRNTLTNREGGVDREQFRVEAVVDRVNTTGKVFLGTTIGCAQCHDHKYDPFTQREYYQLFAFFNSDVEVDIPAPLKSAKEVYAKKKAAYDLKLAELKKAIDDYRKTLFPGNLQKWEAELTLVQLRTLPANISAVLLVDPAKRIAAQQKDIADYYSKIDKKLVQLNKAVTDHQKSAPIQAMAQTLALGPSRKTHVLLRGDFLRPGAEVEPATPISLSPMKGEGKKTRLDLAKWIVDPANPLTARVIVNWMWHHYFGRGLVPTLEDFGVQGDKPSHPELLDYLASEFIEWKWSMKAMHRLIVTSATYRQSSRVRPELLSRDPLNDWLGRQIRPRLEAEIVRDVALASSGLLKRTIGGPSVRPPQPAGISELTYAGSVKWVDSTGTDRYRRGMYTWFQRTSPYPMLMTFDAPDSNICCVRRDRSNSPLQALTLLNDTTFVECAQALGRRLMMEKPAEPSERIRHGFRLCLTRDPSAAELSRLRQLFEELLQTCRARPESAAQLLGKEKLAGADVPEAAAWVALARTIMNLDEFVTRD
ncbi:MAG TPA: PSD1 and planctomycete cytochrome C domain-containing protein, partial [Gemmataceae bacterium]|nr:PSD1 and planctomycete cytochrome C domain-containing protein [Gemmataceae bacterium]